MAEYTKREQAKQKLTPIVEKALDPLGRAYTGTYLEALEISGEIVDLIVAAAKEELIVVISEMIIAGLSTAVQEFNKVADQRIKDTVSTAMTAGGYVKGFR